MNELFVVFKELLSSKLALIELNKLAKPLILEQKYDQINQINSKKNEIYDNIRSIQQRFSELAHSNLEDTMLFESIDFKITFDDIDENTVPRLRQYLDELKQESHTNIDKIQIIEYLLS